MIQQIPPRPLTVRIEDADNHPVPGAVVVFTAPESGPSGEFANNSLNVRLITDQDGVAAAGGYHPNAIKGGYQIRVRAEFQGETAAAAISQTNIASRHSRGRLILIGVLAGAAAAGATLLVRSRNSAPAVSFGSSTVGAPR